MSEPFSVFHNLKLPFSVKLFNNKSLKYLPKVINYSKLDFFPFSGFRERRNIDTVLRWILKKKSSEWKNQKQYCWQVKYLIGGENNITIGTVAELECFPDYGINGLDVVICEAYGWSPAPILGTCQKVHATLSTCAFA